MASLRTLDPSMIPLARAFVAALERRGIRVEVTSAGRGLDEQRQLYADYLAGRSRYPAAPPGRSTHGRGIAFDLRLNSKSPGAVSAERVPWEYALAGRIWESLGLTWGGRFHDPIHFDARRA